MRRACHDTLRGIGAACGQVALRCLICEEKDLAAVEAAMGLGVKIVDGEVAF